MPASKLAPPTQLPLPPASNYIPDAPDHAAHPHREPADSRAAITAAASTPSPGQPLPSQVLADVQNGSSSSSSGSTAHAASKEQQARLLHEGLGLHENVRTEMQSSVQPALDPEHVGVQLASRAGGSLVWESGSALLCDLLWGRG
eukprot:1142859-Pelagomonas_calceolata.AAC.14